MIANPESDQTSPRKSLTVSISSLREDSPWPRRELDSERVAAFVTLYADGGPNALPPLEVVPDGEGKYFLSDGHHRLEALLELDADQAPATVVSPPPGLDPELFAFERALTHCATTAKPLSRVERRAAALKLIDDRLELSDRQIAELTGMSHQTVGRLRKGMAGGSADRDAPDDAGTSYLATVTADDIARRVVTNIAKLWNGRGLSDALMGDRTGHRLAVALRETHDTDALNWARRLNGWISAAVAELQANGRR